MKNKIRYEARLNRNITRTPYNSKTIYKKGTVIWICTEKTFLKIQEGRDKVENWTDLSICEGHGVYEYFDLFKDIEFFKVETIIELKENLVSIKNEK